MYYSHYKNETGEYVNAYGVRYSLMAVPSAGGQLWTWFDSIDDCLTAWGLTYDPLPEPATEPVE